MSFEWEQTFPSGTLLCQTHLFGKYRLNNGAQWTLIVTSEMGESRSICHCKRSSLILDVWLRIPTHLLSSSPGLKIMSALETSSQWKTLVWLSHVVICYAAKNMWASTSVFFCPCCVSFWVKRWVLKWWSTVLADSCWFSVCVIWPSNGALVFIMESWKRHLCC